MASPTTVALRQGKKRERDSSGRLDGNVVCQCPQCEGRMKASRRSVHFCVRQKFVSVEQIKPVDD